MSEPILENFSVTKNVAARKTLGINELYLSGFQVFKEPTHIPIRRLTLLYGPNSAGKSAVEDALVLIGEMCRSNGFDIDPKTRAPRLKRHWRRTSESIEGFTDTMVLGVKARVQQFEWHKLDYRLHLERWVGKDGTYEFGARNKDLSDREEIDVEYRATFSKKRTTSRYRTVDFERRIDLLLDGEIAIWLDDDSFGVNFRNPHLRGLDSEFEQNGNFEMVRSSAFSNYHDGVVKLKGWLGLHDNRRINREGLHSYFENCTEGGGGDDPEAQRVAQLFDNSAAVADEILPYLAELFDLLYEMALRSLQTYVGPDVVPASRTIPTQQDLTFHFDPASEKDELGELRLHGNDFSMPWATADISGHPAYYSLAKAYRSTLSNNPVRKRLASQFGDPGLAYAEKVNQLLADHLFLERGYRLGFDYRVILGPSEFQNIRSDGSNDKGAGDYELLLRLFLVDSAGREFSFSEVGSGLGYVLPVLVAACDLTERVMISQQPELHLHPALQSELGDVFVDASNCEAEGEKQGLSRRVAKRFIIETHSEHILLRVLRRIRQSHFGRADGKLKIFADEVSVVYFDPQPEGFTKVKQLPISEDGEFLVRWPRGFFTEREADLFDDDYDA